MESRRFHTFVLMVLHKQHFFGAECQRQIGPAILSDASEGNQNPVGTGWSRYVQVRIGQEIFSLSICPVYRIYFCWVLLSLLVASLFRSWPGSARAQRSARHAD